VESPLEAKHWLAGPGRPSPFESAALVFDLPGAVDVPKDRVALLLEVAQRVHHGGNMVGVAISIEGTLLLAPSLGEATDCF
jgi:hypothetical protein